MSLYLLTYKNTIREIKRLANIHNSFEAYKACGNNERRTIPDLISQSSIFVWWLTIRGSVTSGMPRSDESAFGKNPWYCRPGRSSRHRSAACYPRLRGGFRAAAMTLCTSSGCTQCITDAAENQQRVVERGAESGLVEL